MEFEETRVGKCMIMVCIALAAFLVPWVGYLFYYIIDHLVPIN